MPTIAPHDFGCYVQWAGFVCNQPAFALVEGDVCFPTLGGKRLTAHDGLLSAALARDRKTLVTCGEDGRVVRLSPDGAQQLTKQERKWIDVVACGPNGAVGFASGRTAWVITADTLKQFDHSHAVEGLDFAPKGMRLACGRYNGVSLHWISGSAAAEDLSWDGAHTAVRFSPNGKYVVTSMAENALHGWLLDSKKPAQGKHMRMSGYPAKPKSLSWSPKGRWLASSGAHAAICWPFFGKDGPMGKSPRELAPREDALVVEVACHPSQDVVAVGYDDGMITAVKIEDGAATPLRRPGKGKVSTLGWDDAGLRLAFGTQEGEAGIINISSI